MSISLRRNAPALWHRIGLGYISGGRVLRRDLIAPHLAEMVSRRGFGFEVWLNDLAIVEAARIAVVHWPLVDSPAKLHKRDVAQDLLVDAPMMAEIVCTGSPLKDPTCESSVEFGWDEQSTRLDLQDPKLVRLKRVAKA